ncbi:MAG: 4,5-DOPA dioxygenase extradiol [bacterium]
MQPVLFIGHGSPINAIENNPFTQSLKSLGEKLLPVPKAIMVISAHWLNSVTLVSTNPKPKTIHDFFGFPDELYHVQYPAPGAKDYVLKLLKTIPGLKEDDEADLDHGAWSILKHLFPKANIPVFQLSIDYYKPMSYHFELGEKLSYLRNHDVLIIGSGNIVHNLDLFEPNKENNTLTWAVEFDGWVKDCINNRDFQSLINYEECSKNFHLAVPGTDHYIPMLYALGAVKQDDKIEFTYEEVISSISMRCFKVG